MIPRKIRSAERAKLLALTLACRSARALLVKYRQLAISLNLAKEEKISAEHVLHQIDDALR